MRLLDLNASFVGNWHPGGMTQLPTVEGAQGIVFQCPKCAEGKERGEEDGRRFVRGAHYVICWFANPRNATKVPDDADPKPGRWIFEGDTVDTVSFTGPGAASVLLASPTGCQWHGYIRSGEATLQ